MLKPMIEYETTPDGVQMHHEYDIQGNQIKTVFGDGKIIYRQFDYHHHITHRMVYQGTTLILEETYQYDLHGNQTYYAQHYPYHYHWRKTYDENGREIEYINSKGYCITNE